MPDFRNDSIAATLAAPQVAGEDLAEQGEPVAWAYEYRENGNWRTFVVGYKPWKKAFVRNIRPLYAAPAPSRPTERHLMPYDDLEELEDLRRAYDRLHAEIISDANDDEAAKLKRFVMAAIKARSYIASFLDAVKICSQQEAPAPSRPAGEDLAKLPEGGADSALLSEPSKPPREGLP